MTPFILDMRKDTDGICLRSFDAEAVRLICNIVIYYYIIADIVRQCVIIHRKR